MCFSRSQNGVTTPMGHSRVKSGGRLSHTDNDDLSTHQKFLKTVRDLGYNQCLMVGLTYISISMHRCSWNGLTLLLLRLFLKGVLKSGYPQKAHTGTICNEKQMGISSIKPFYGRMDSIEDPSSYTSGRRCFPTYSICRPFAVKSRDSTIQQHKPW